MYYSVVINSNLNLLDQSAILNFRSTSWKTETIVDFLVSEIFCFSKQD